MNWFQFFLVLVFGINFVSSDLYCKTCTFGNYHMVNSFLLESPAKQAMNVTAYTKKECFRYFLAISPCNGTCIEILLNFDRNLAKFSVIRGCSSDLVVNDTDAPPRNDFVPLGELVMFKKCETPDAIQYIITVVETPESMKQNSAMWEVQYQKPKNESLSDWLPFIIFCCVFLICCCSTEQH